MSDNISIKELRKGFEDADDIDEVESLIRHTLSHLEKTLSGLKSERDRADKDEAMVVEETDRADLAESRIRQLEAGIRELFASREDFDVQDIALLLEYRNLLSLERAESDRNGYAWHGLAKLVGLVDADGEPVPEAIHKLMPAAKATS